MSNQKLSFRFYGPFNILAIVGAVAKLDLPDDCRIHTVIHVSHFKCHMLALVPLEFDISSIPEDASEEVYPIQFLFFFRKPPIQFLSSRKI
jgi:hypothetical protein